jgi:GTPase SAR1 family protein
LKQIESHASEDVIKILVANKTDLGDRAVSTEQGQALANEHNLSYFETSAFTGANIGELFHHVAAQIIKEKPNLTQVAGS